MFGPTQHPRTQQQHPPARYISFWLPLNLGNYLSFA